MRKSFLVLALLITALWVRAQEDAYVDTLAYYEQVAEEGIIHEDRSFNEARLQEHRDDPRYQYEVPPQPVETSWWDRFLAWLEEVFRKLFGEGAGRVLKVLLNEYLWYVVIFGLALLLLITAIRKGVFTMAFRGKARQATVITDVHEELHREDLDELANAAEAQGEWRRAVRLRYLQVLRHGMNQGKLLWRPEFTDRDYAHQFTDAAERTAFSNIAFTFQWVWYGDAPLEKENYFTLIAPFRAFTQRMAA